VILCDVNVLLAAMVERSPHHAVFVEALTSQAEVRRIEPSPRQLGAQVLAPSLPER
jgi:predicted nucleic acid-binding protein